MYICRNKPEESEAEAGLAGPGAAHEADLLLGEDGQVKAGQHRGQLLPVSRRVLFELYPSLLWPTLPIGAEDRF